MTCSGIDPLNIELVEVDGEILIIEEEDFEIVEVAEQGPAGTAGQTFIVTEEEMAYSKRTNFVGDTLIYKGEALPGSNEAASVWRVRRLTFGVDGDVIEQWAGGTANFDKVWADHETLSYS